MKSKEALQEDAGLVRDIEAWCKAQAANDHERNGRDALLRKAAAVLPELEIAHVRRINEALCDMDYPSATALGVRQLVLDRLARHHNLKQYRAVPIPVVKVPEAKGKA